MEFNKSKIKQNKKIKQKKARGGPAAREPPGPRKSVGVEVNWGVRFASDGEAAEFLDELSEVREWREGGGFFRNVDGEREREGDWGVRFLDELSEVREWREEWSNFRKCAGI